MTFGPDLERSRDSLAAIKFPVETDDPFNMIERFLQFATVALRAVELHLEQSEMERQRRKLQEFVPAQARLRRPVRAIEVPRH